METIRLWLLLFLQLNTPTPKGTFERSEVESVREAAVEAAMAVAFDPTEPELTRSPTARAEVALRLLVISVHETGLRPRLWRGECRPKECDGGLATGELQLHLRDRGGDGLRLVGDRRLEGCKKEEPDCITPAIALDDHTAAWRVGLHILRAGGLNGYTGNNRPVMGWIQDVEQKFLSAHPASMPPKE